MKTSYYFLFLIIALALAGFVGLIAYYSYTPTPPKTGIQQPNSQENLIAQSLNRSIAPTRPIITNTDPVRGEINAPLAIVEFADFFCPACVSMEDTLRELLDDYQGKIKLIWKDLPNTRAHPLAQKAAQAARCAQEQGKFWEYHDLLFESADQEQSWSEQRFSLIAQNLNLDIDLFTECLNSERTANLIERSVSEALLLKIDATPYLFINEQRFSGAVSKQKLREAIDTQL